LYQTLCQTATPYQTEELLWTLTGVQAVEHSIKHPGQLTVYAEQPLVSQLADWPGVTVLAEKPVLEADWAESWKQHWHVTPITPGLTVRPSWQPYTPQHPHEVVLTLDPGAAFGTGTHETTRLMLTVLDTLRQTMDYAQTSVLDVGTGSGILAIACGLLGATQIRGQDIDPKVIPVATANAAMNSQTHIDWTAEPLQDLCHTRYDLVLANILAPVIVELMPELVTRLAPGGLLLTSGIIHKAAPSVDAAAIAHGLTPENRWIDGEWCALAYRAAL
jgi:ribosomal protein L11 methyltransferase